MIEWLTGVNDFPSRWYCGSWSDALGWTHIVADFLIFAAYMAIPFALYWYRARGPVMDRSRKAVTLLFSAFIFMCGMGHLAEIVIMWVPIYRVAAAIKVGTAAVSIVAAVGTYIVLPVALDRAKSVLDEAKDLGERIDRSHAEISRLTGAWRIGG